MNPQRTAYIGVYSLALTLFMGYFVVNTKKQKQQQKTNKHVKCIPKQNSQIQKKVRVLKNMSKSNLWFYI